MTIRRLLLSPRFVIPLTMGVGVLFLALRIGDIWDTVSSGKLSTPTAMAQTTPAPDAAAPATPPASGAPNVTPPALSPAPKAEGDKPASTASIPEITIPDDASPAEMEVLKQLSNRRQELEKRSHDLDTREDLLKIAEQRVDSKIQDMDKLRKQLQAMVTQVSETQAAQLENLVKIYETMKPKDAAKIFEGLDMPVLLSVIQRMKPARTAPILAEMNPDKAKEVTVALTKQDKLPQVK